jgi:hypothetical protein
MTIQSSSINVDGTVATTGGTATSLKKLGSSLERFNSYLDDGSEFLTRTEIDFTIKEPKVSVGAPNGYTQQRSNVKILVPLVLDNGNLTVNTLTISLAVDHEMTDAEIESMLVLGAQILHDSDYSDFWKNQALD